MTRLLQFLFLLCFCVAGYGGQLITATITVTNTPADGDTITVNGSTRTWKTTVTTAASQITIGASIGANATNMFNQFSGTPFTTLTLARSGTNGVTLRGIVDQTITVSIAGTWGNYTLSTNTTADTYSVTVPGSTHQTQSRATNIISLLVADIGTYSTNSIGETATALANFVNETQTQTFGNKTITNSTLSGTVTNANGGFQDLYVTNFYSHGSVNVTNTNPKIILYDSNAAADEKAINITTANGEFTIDSVNDADSALETILSVSRTGYVVDSVAIPNGETQVESLQVGQTTEFQRLNHTSLANGNNAGVNFNSSSFVKVKAGPTAAFAICGIAGGANGRVITIYNATGQNMTIANDSGVDPTAANRIYTNTGADIATTGNGVVVVQYDSEDSRWIVVSIRD